MRSRRASRRTSASRIRRCRKRTTTITRCAWRWKCLSGGMSGRLFTEIREKRGLCYSVSAGYSSLKGSGSIFGYAGTSNDRAQATLDCFIGEIHRLQDGVTEAELARAKTGLKASTIMQGESTSARAGASPTTSSCAAEFARWKRSRAAIDSVTRGAGECLFEEARSRGRLRL